MSPHPRACVLTFGLLAWTPHVAAGMADGFTWDGFIETYHATRTQLPRDTQAARARLRLEVRGDIGDSQVFARGTAERDLEGREHRAELDEAYVDRVGEGWDLRLGRQVVIWGRADGLRIVDRVSPSDQSESLTRDLDEVRLGVDALRLRRLEETRQWELIWVPRFRPGKAPRGAWALPRPVPEGEDVVYASAEKPGHVPADGVLAARWAYYGPGLDLALSLLHTWEDLPSLERRRPADGGTGTTTLVPRHHRLTLLGLEFARPWRSFVFRGEAVYGRGRRHEPARWDADLYRKDFVQWMAGVDWTPEAQWTLTAQVADEWILDHETGMAAEAHSPVVTVGLTTTFLRETLKLSNLLYWRPEEDGFYNRFSLDYALTDRFHASAGLDLFTGEKGVFAAYEENDQLWIKLKYSF